MSVFLSHPLLLPALAIVLFLNILIIGIFRKNAWTIMLSLFLVTVLVIGGIWGVKLMTFQEKMAKKNEAGPPKQTVSTLRASLQPWQDHLKTVGTIKAINGADLTFEMSGTIDSIKVKSGQTVKEGTIIAMLRADEERARLKSLRVNAALAASNNQRDRKQFAVSAISKAQMDASNAMRTTTAAALQEQQARLNKKILRAPFSGTLGIIVVDVGQFVTVGRKVVSLQSFDPINLDFYIPQEKLPLLNIGQEVLVNAYQKSFTGKIIAIDNTVDLETHNVLVRAQIANPHKKLRPGMFMDVTIKVGEEKSLLTLPQTAIVYSPYGESVYQVTNAKVVFDRSIKKARANGVDEKTIADMQPPKDLKQKVVRQVFITTGATRGDQVEVVKGINRNDEIVTSGQIKLKNGTAIVINNSVQPSNESAPSIADPQ